MKLKEIQITCRKSHLLVALCKFNIKVSDQGMNVIIALNLEAECRSKFQFFSLHCINIYFLFGGERNDIYMQMSVTLRSSVQMRYFSISFNDQTQR